MNIGLIPKRYARALLKFAQEHSVDEQVFREMLVLEHALRDLPQLRTALSNPILPVKTKRSLLLAAVKNHSEIYERFIQLVLKNRRESLLRSIALRYEELYRESNDINSGTLITATHASQGLVDKIRLIFGKVKSGKLELETIVDPTIEGGFIFDFDTYRLDASVRTQLGVIKKQFIEENNRRG